MNKPFFLIALLVLVAGIAIWMVPDIYNTEPDPDERFLNEIHSRNRYLSTDEIARRIIADDPTVFLVDVRAEYEFEEYTLPGSVNIALDNILGDEWADTLSTTVRDVILFSNDDIIAEQAWALCEQQGYPNLFVMQGGLNRWFETIMLPKEPGELASTEEIELYQFRTGASIYFGSGTVEVPVVVEVEVEEDEKPKPVEKKTIPVKKKVKVEDEGGC